MTQSTYFIQVKNVLKVLQGYTKGIRFIALLTILCTIGVGQMWGAEKTYTFTSKSWGDSESAWTSNRDGGQLTSGRGVQVSTTYTGAGATSKSEFNNVSRVVVVYSTNASNGAGTINMQIGSNAQKSFKVTSSDGTTDRNAEFSFSPAESGKVKLTINCTTNSIYVKSITIETSESGGEDPGTGGEDPEPEPGTGGEAASYTWDLTKASYSASSTSQVTWSATDVNMVLTKESSTTDANNYLGGTNAHTRVYKDQKITFTPAANVTITSIEIVSTSTDYAGNFKSSTWSNATAAASGSTVTITPSNGANAIICTITAATRASKVTVNYTKAASGDPEPVIVKTLKSIAVTGMTTAFEQGDVFKFDGTCTATYSVTKDGVAQADETAEVTPTSVSTPNMNTIGTQTITVTYETVTTTYDITINENEVTPDTYDVLLNNVLWNVSAGQQTASVESMTGKANDITFYTTKGSSQMYASATQTRFYNGATFVISVPTGYVIKSIEFAEPTSDKKWEGSITVNAGTYTDGTKTWTGSAQEVQFTFNAQNRIANVSITYEAIDLTLPSAPTFTPAAGTYNAAQTVTITAEDGATIYYTLDGNNPTNESNVYSSALTISETTTLKAIAVKDEKVSPVATATYTINLPLTTMDQIFAKATAVGSTATSVEITFGNWVVSAVKEDGKTAFVTDGTKGFAIFDKDVHLGFSVGNTLSGTATCKVQLYNGFAELTELKSNTAGLSVGSGGTITTQELDATAIEALTGVNTGSLIKINGICSSTELKYYVAGVQIYTSLYNFGTLEVGAEYNITGIYQQYHSTQEMLPRSAEDIEKVVGLPTATISIADITMEVGETKTIEATITPDAAQSTVQYAITAGSEYIDLDGTTITAVAAGTATITATIAEKADEYKGATKEFTVTVKPQNIAVLPFTFNGGKEDVKNTLGMSHNDLEDDYNSAPKLKFNGAGDNVIIHFDSEPGEFSFLLKQNGSNAGTFTVYESANGEDYTSVWSGGDLGGNGKSATIEPTLSATARYVKFEYTTKGNSTNYALGSISITKPDTRQEAGIAWSTESVEITIGDAFTAPTLSNPNELTLTCTSTNEELATVTNAGVITLQSGVTGTATITASFAGNEDYNAAEVSCTIIVTDVAAVYTVTWYVNGMLVHTQQVDAGDEVTPPEVNSIPCGDVLAGWTDAENGNYVHGTSTLHEGAQPSIEVAEDKTFYAVLADYE